MDTRPANSAVSLFI